MKFSKSLLLFLAFGFIATASSIFFQDVQTSSAQLGQSGGSSIAVRDLILVNADTNQDIGPLTNGYTLNVSAFGTENYSVRAETQPSQVGSVRFALNNNANFQTENILPYALGGDSQGGTNYNPVVFEEGQNTITATPFTKRNGGGQSGVAKTITFNVVYGGQEGAPRGPEEDGGAENIVGNGVQAIAPDPSASYIPGQQGVPFTCDIGTDPGFHVWKLVFSSYQIAGGSTNVYTFATYEGVEYTTGQYTETITIPQEAQPGTYVFHCVAYFYDGNTGTYSPTGLGPAEDGLEVQIGSHQEPTGETNSISITSPATNSNVVVGQPFTFSVQGSPTNDEIQNVSFYMHPGFGGLDVDPILLGSDTSSPFSIQASVSDRYYRCPHIYAVADLNDGTQIKTTNLHPVAITESPTNSPWQCTPQSIGGNSYDFSITSPQWASTSDPGYDAGVPFTISAQNNLSGATMDYVKFYTADTFDGLNGWGFNLVSTDTTAPYTTQATINSPADYGHPYFTNHVRAIAYYSNGQVEPRLMPIKINPQVNPTTNPQITSLELVTASGQVIETLEGGEVINTGIGGYGPNISIRANANADTGSVLFNLQKPIGNHTQAENNTPYSLFGDSNGTYATWQDLQNGPHTLTVTPYELDGQTGVTGIPVTIQFSLENNDDLIAPSVPANVEIEYRSNSTARVSWDASTDNVGVTGYQVYKNGNVEGLSTGNLYKDLTSFQTGDVLTVRATDAAGNWSGDSNPANIPILSTQFTNGQTVSVPSGQTAIVYSAPPSTSSNGNQTGGSQGTIQGSSIFWNGGYYWNVNFGSGPDGWVAQSSLTSNTGGGTPPGTPSGLQILGKTQVSVTAKWNASSGSVDYYEVEGYSGVNGGGTLKYSETVPGSQTTETVMNLNIAQSSGDQQSVRVRACNSGGCSNWTGYLNTNTAGPNNMVTETPSKQNAVRATATVSGSNVTISWPESGSMTVSRKGLDETSWTTLPGTYTGSYTGSISSGTTYEYRIANGNTAYGYVAVSNNEVIEDSNGHIVIVVAQNLWGNSQVSQALDSYEAGLIADGWVPIRIQATSSSDSTRNLIIAEYNDQTQDVKAVTLVGRVPIKNTGGINPDGHGSRPFPTDLFYGDMDGNWGAETSLNDTVELQVGRIDFAGISGNEVTHTVNYFNKLNNFKTGNYVPKQRAVILDGFNPYRLTESGWRSITSILGTSTQNVAFLGDDWVAWWNNSGGALDRSKNTIINNSWLWVSGAGGGGNEGYAGGPSSTDYLNNNVGGVFNTMIGSYFLDWSPGNNILRAALAGPGEALTNMWTGRPNAFFHRMAAGENIGESVRISWNNTINSSGDPNSPGTLGYNFVCGCEDWPGGNTPLHMSFMGDPTLRLSYFQGPTNLNVTSSGSQTQFTWNASPESGIDGYNVYRVNRNNGTFTKLNGSIITGTSYNSSTSYATGDEFVVRAQKTKTTASGRYKNLSLGAYGVLASGGQGGNPPSTAFSQGDTVIVNDGTN